MMKIKTVSKPEDAKKKKFKLKAKMIDIDGIYKNRYVAFNDGTVYDNIHKRWVMLNFSSGGYLRLVLGGPEGPKSYYAHRIVAMVFMPIKNPKKYQVNHIDGDKGNNCITNLEWVTGSENMQHATTTGLFNPNGEGNGNSKYSDAQTEEVCRLLAENKLTNQQIAEVTGVSAATVSMIKIGKVRGFQSSKYHWETIPFSEKKGENHNMVKINKQIVIKICELLSSGMGSKNIVEELGAPVTKAIVNNIKFRKTWTDISKDYEWEIDHSKAYNKGKSK